MKHGKESRLAGLPFYDLRGAWPAGKEHRRGAALILTLLITAMLTMMVIAFFTTMQIEQRAAHSYADAQRAKMVAQGAVSHGIELLRSNIPEPALISESAENAPGENWAINPGRLTVVRSPGGETVVPLHTGGADRSPNETNDPDVYSVDLNEPLPGRDAPSICVSVDSNGSPQLDAPTPSMRVKWVPVMRDPELVASEENPISARYAFWMDDESSKINFNVALGKPARHQADPAGFWEQYNMGLMTPLFTSGQGDVEFNDKSEDREWALGQPRSVNLDVLFENRGDLVADQLLAHAWLRGFSRYPEAILDFVNLDEEKRHEWYVGNRFNLTFYSRSPEFNTFGRPRLFTTHTPLSLEAGPLYQLPFVYNGPEAPDPDYNIEGVLHLNSLLGSMGFTSGVQDENNKRVLAGNVVNRAQFEMLMRYMSRKWPGYDVSFVDKYGERECYQMALSMILMARLATTTVSNKGTNRGTNFSRDWALRTSSTIYSPSNGTRRFAQPERHYWQIEVDDGTPEIVPMLPQSPGPHITEVLLTFQAVADKSGKKKIRFRYQVEYYMPEFGPELFLKYFPVKVDYFGIEPVGPSPPGMPVSYELGPTDSEEVEKPNRNGDHNWNYNPTRPKPDPKKGRLVDKLSLGSLRVSPGNNIRIVSRSSTKYNKGKYKPTERRVVSSPWRFLGKNMNFLPHVRDKERTEDGKKEDEDKPLLIASTFGSIQLDVKWRLGMGISSDASRAIQMIPMGETDAPEHVLEASFELDTRFSGGPQTVSWQINDPRLSWNKDSWVVDTEDGGTPGAINSVAGGTFEPEEDSSEKSKYRYFQRGPGRVQSSESGAQFSLNRPDEYNSRSRVTSKGYWSMLHTGIQGNPVENQPPTPWRTLDLGGGNSNQGADPPDYLLLDLLGATYPMQHDQWKINSTLPDEFSTVSFMNSTAGQINLNSKIYPDDSPYFQPPRRTKPLEAVFRHLRTDSEIEGLVEQVGDHQQSSPFLYIGELSEVDGYLRDPSATQFENEELLRNMAGCLTTKSNTFGLWGASQVVKKIRGHSAWGKFEDGDQVLAEKRFFALIERYVWPGNDNIPGNGHVDMMGVWDRIAEQAAPIPFDGSTTDTLYQLPGSPPMKKIGETKRLQLDRNGTYPWYDGPQEVEMDRYVTKALGKVKWQHSSLDEAYNPPQPVIKYRVVYFKYLDE